MLHKQHLLNSIGHVLATVRAGHTLAASLAAGARADVVDPEHLATLMVIHVEAVEAGLQQLVSMVERGARPGGA